jgi:hypothetical protein
VHQAIEDRIGKGWVTDDLVPVIDGQLKCGLYYYADSEVIRGPLSIRSDAAVGVGTDVAPRLLPLSGSNDPVFSLYSPFPAALGGFPATQPV